MTSSRDPMERAIWDAEAERDWPEALGDAEEARLDDWAQREMERTWGA